MLHTNALAPQSSNYAYNSLINATDTLLRTAAHSDISGVSDAATFVLRARACEMSGQVDRARSNYAHALHVLEF